MAEPVTTKTLTLADFLLARIAEDEAAAQEGPGIHLSSCVYVAKDWLCDCQLPARVLAECEVKRRIIRLARRLDEHGGDPLVGIFVNIAALPYADHPDYRPEWA